MLTIWPVIVVVLSTATSSPATSRRQERLDALAGAVHEVAPPSWRVSLERAYLHAGAALEAEEVEGVPAEVLLGVAYVESHWTEDARSGRTHRGRYCGAMQATMDQYGYGCVELQTARVGYRVGAVHVKRWLRGRPIRRALYGYGGCAKNGSHGYPDRVLRAVVSLRKAVARRAVVK